MGTKKSSDVVLSLAVVGILCGCEKTTEALEEGAPSKERLTQLFHQFSGQSDQEKVFRLVCWDRVSDDDRTAFKRSLEVDFKERIKRVEVTALGDGESLEYTQGGITYRPNLDVVGRLVVTFAPRTPEQGEDGSYTVPPSQTSYLVGEKGGRYYIALAAPADG